MENTKKPLRILPFVIGSLGSFTYEFQNLLRTLRTPTRLFKKIACDISPDVLQDSFSLYVNYMGPNRPPIIFSKPTPTTSDSIVPSVSALEPIAPTAFKFKGNSRL
ncbi:hypothetical protein RF11_02891 [Thelohanellus kitauei]|uniref:Uncharacterized protein n=1 Tax=Thelohanellus kitauei TaxID=669202 RepID=A0A0C2NE32_THEKT|nr:hypothetical protein RF11_02891 [Thelohanellus kitauei]